MSLSICELHDLHAGNLKCKICGGTAHRVSMKCHTCFTIDKFIDNSIDDILDDLGSLLALGAHNDFIESVLEPRAGSLASRRLLHILRRVSRAIEERKAE